MVLRKKMQSYLNRILRDKSFSIWSEDFKMVFRNSNPFSYFQIAEQKVPPFGVQTVLSKENMKWPTIFSKSLKKLSLFRFII